MSTVEPGPKAFAYEAQTSDGQALRGTLQAASADEASSKLTSLQLRVLSVVPAPAAKTPPASLGADEFLIFNQQLAHLTEAGLPVESGLRLIAIDLKSGRLARATMSVASELERGTPLAEAFSRHAADFPPLYGRLVEAGAHTGNLPGMLYNLGRHLELVSRLRRSIWRTIAYPIMVLAAMSLVLLFVAVFVLPQFNAIYSDFRTTLPDLTVFMLKAARIYPWLFIVGWGLVLAVTIGDGIARAAAGRGIPWVSLLGYLPEFGSILRANLLARWVDALRLGVESGLDLPRAIQLAAAACGDAALQQDAARLVTHAGRGEALAGVRTRRIPATVLAAIDLTAATGSGAKLPAVLHGLSRMYEQQAEHRLQILPSILAPVILVGIALGVGVIIASMFLPLVKLIQSVSGGA